MRFDPEDGLNGGPRCRNCHKGSSGCGGCHNTDATNFSGVVTADPDLAAMSYNIAAGGYRSSITDMFAIIMDMMPGSGFTYADHFTGAYKPWTLYNQVTTSDGQTNHIQDIVAGGDLKTLQVKSSRMVEWSTMDWRSDENASGTTCSDDGISWPHRTLGWKMLKDDLFGIDVVGLTTGEQQEVAVGQTRTFAGFQDKSDGLEDLYVAIAGNRTTLAHDLDSVCLDCHNPTVWNATGPTHTDTTGTAYDDYNDDMMMRGLP